MGHAITFRIRRARQKIPYYKAVVEIIIIAWEESFEEERNGRNKKQKNFGQSYNPG